MTFSLTEQSILSAFTSDQCMTEKGSEICQDLIENKYDISSFVESLGFALTSQEVGLRVKGCKLLSFVLAKLPSHHLSAVQLECIVLFYCDRLKDHHNVIPAIIDGLLSLVYMQNLEEGAITKIVTHFFQHVSCQNQNREDREKIYSLLKLITRNHPKEVAVMGANYVHNIMQAIDGERDPRNLVLIFEFMPTFIENFPLHHLAEDMFETFACYFPVDFHPMKDDPQSITRDLLAEKLSYCLVASSTFAEWVVPLAVEKLQSDLIVAKLDSLALLSRCCDKFEAVILDQHFDDIWTHLKSEILPGGSNNDILTMGFATLESILKRAAGNADANKNIQTKILSNIIPYLSNIHHHLLPPAFRIAEICVRCSPAFAAEKVLGTVALQLEQNELEIDSKIKLLMRASRILDICSTTKTLETMDNRIAKPLQTTILQGINANDVETIMQAWSVIASSLGLMSQQQRKEVYHRLLETLTDDTNSRDLSSVIKKYVEKYPDEISANVIDIICGDFYKLSINAKRNVYLNLTQLSKIPHFEDRILTMLVNQIFDSASEAEVMAALFSLRTLLEPNVNPCFIRRVWCNYNVMENFRRLVQTEKYEKETFREMSLVISLFVPHLSIDDQQKIVDEYMAEAHSDIPSNVFIMQGIFAHVNEKVEIGPHFRILLCSIVRMCLESEDDILRSVGHALLSSLVNRIEPTEDNHKEIKAVVKFLEGEIENGRKAAVELLAWIGKGLLVRGYEGVGDIIGDISQLLGHPSLSSSAELAFDIMSREVPELHLPVTKFLYKQKFFHIVLDKLWGKLVQFEEKHLNAFALALAMVPHSIVRNYLEKVAPIIFKCIEANKTKTAHVALVVVKNFLIERNEYFRAHFSHLIPQLMKLAGKHDAMAVRIDALECLEEICKYPVFAVQPYKVDVILGLAHCLDDKKRMVRLIASRTRNVWFLVGTEKSSSNN